MAQRCITFVEVAALVMSSGFCSSMGVGLQSHADLDLNGLCTRIIVCELSAYLTVALREMLKDSVDKMKIM